MEVKEKYCAKKPWYRKWWIWMLGVGLTIIPPFFIHLAYMKGRTLKEPNTFYSAGDCLSYYGTLLAALATIVVLYVTISENQKTLQNGMKEHRLKERYIHEITIAQKIVDILLLKKYNDILFQDNKSLMEFSYDINYVYFETLGRIPASEGNLSCLGAFYKNVDCVHSHYKAEIDKLLAVISPGEEKEHLTPAETKTAFDSCRKSILQLKNTYQNGLLLSQKGLEVELETQMNRQIDELYGLKEATTDDKT